MCWNWLVLSKNVGLGLAFVNFKFDWNVDACQAVVSKGGLKCQISKIQDIRPNFDHLIYFYELQLKKHSQQI